MQYLIDGHNLIPKIPGLSLSDPDDEQQLIEQLSAWSRVSKNQVTVFFDRAPLGQAGIRNSKPITAVFVRDGKTADDAIRDALAKLKRAAKNVIVVSSDRMVQASAREVNAKVIKSEDFAINLKEVQSISTPLAEKPMPSSDDNKYWEELFTSKKE